MPSAPRRRYGRATGLIGLAIGVLVLVGAIGFGTSQIWGHARAYAMEVAAASVALDRAVEQPTAALATARPHLAAARDELEALRPVADPLAATAAWLANRHVGAPLTRQAAASWRFADAATALGEGLIQVTEDGLGGLNGGGAGLAAAGPDLLRGVRAAEGTLARAQAARADIGTPVWPLDRLAPELARWDAAAPRLTELLTEADRIMSAMPLALGIDRPLTFLVLAQTSDDLRATGGFISSIGTVRVEGGRIVGFDFEKVYAAEGIEVPGPDDGVAVSVPPPDPLARYMGLSQWRLRDANWWADFPTTARQAATFWESMRGTPVDGVIAFDEAALESVLEGVGAVTLDDGTVVTAGNLRDVTLDRVFRGDEPAGWYAAQSAFSRDLARSIIATAERLTTAGLMRLGHQLHAATARRDLLVAGFDPRLAAILRYYGVDGALLGGRDDHVYLVEQNVSYGKLSPFIRQQLDLTVELDAAARPRRERLTIDVVNTYAPGLGRPGYPSHYYNGLRWNPVAGRLDVREGYYGGYTRLYLPLGSRVLGISGFDEMATVGTEGGRTVIGGYVGLEMGAGRRVQVEWEPVGSTDEIGRYRLLVQRQPGAPSRELTVRAILPDGSPVGAASPPPTTAGPGAVTWREELDRDRVFDVTLDAFDPLIHEEP